MRKPWCDSGVQGSRATNGAGQQGNCLKNPLGTTKVSFHHANEN